VRRAAAGVQGQLGPATAGRVLAVCFPDFAALSCGRAYLRPSRELRKNALTEPGCHAPFVLQLPNRRGVAEGQGSGLGPNPPSITTTIKTVAACSEGHTRSFL
jgi:hypothetical protein